MEFLRSFLRRQFAGKPLVASGNVFCLISYATLPGAIIGHRNWISFLVMGLVPSKWPNVLFLAEIVPSRVTRVRIFCLGAA